MIREARGTRWRRRPPPAPPRPACSTGRSERLLYAGVRPTDRLELSRAVFDQLRPRRDRPAPRWTASAVIDCDQDNVCSRPRALTRFETTAYALLQALSLGRLLSASLTSSHESLEGWSIRDRSRSARH